jgi:hypothetical protein
MHAYGCSRCDADFVRNSKRLDERDALRARVAELEAALRDVAERQREACAVAAENYVTDADLCGTACRDEVDAVGHEIRFTPLVEVKP